MRMPRRNYSTAKWQTRFKNLAKAGGKGAHKTLDRPAYSAFWRRFPRSAWKLENKRKKRGRKRNMKRRKGTYSPPPFAYYCAQRGGARQGKSP